ncbi:hypothetical protein QO005_002594 [Rhizobium paknamense]|uniref:Uncharacterized protein n=1 Tax=Rhizobium paknamense TaxID=1206817 RepID=A0ABU0IDC6_9HYPH|nr:hypothetical protein [Rhizobium paknamense]
MRLGRALNRSPQRSPDMRAFGDWKKPSAVRYFLRVETGIPSCRKKGLMRYEVLQELTLIKVAH